LDLEQVFKDFKKKFGEDLPYTTYLSYKFYPKVTEDYLLMYRKYGDVDVVPTRYFLYGMKPGEETTVQIAPGKTLLVRLQSIGPADEKGMRTAFFKLNGQTRNIEVQDRSVKVFSQENRKAEKENEWHVASPLQGMLSKIFVKKGDQIKKNQPLFMVEAMKMETNIAAHHDGIVGDIILAPGTLVNTDDLVMEIVAG
jgi:pyruvate carboxylase